MRHIPRAVVAVAAFALGGMMLVTPAFGTSGVQQPVSPSEVQQPVKYVALGDSYASGVGTRDYIKGSGDCLRSRKAYSYLWQKSHQVASFTFAACSGATTRDLNSGQLQALKPDTNLVTVTIGGNDIGFTTVVQKCLKGTNRDCDQAVSAAERKAREQLPGLLDKTYGNIASAAPKAKVVVVGYPRINELGNCDIRGYTEKKRARLNEGADLLAKVTGDRAKAAGFSYVDPRQRFDGHGVCGDQEWINGPTKPLWESFHPNVAGHGQGYLPLVTDAIG